MGFLNRSTGLLAVFFGNIAIAALHFAFPKIDYVSIGLLEASLIPAYTLFISKFKVSKDSIEIVTAGVVTAATHKALDDSLDDPVIAAPALLDGQTDFAASIRIEKNQDPSAVLVALSSDVESRLRGAALAANINTNGETPLALLNALVERNILDSRSAQGFAQIIQLGHRASHGADVTPEAATVAKSQTLRLLSKLTMAKMGAFIESKVVERANAAGRKVLHQARTSAIDFVVDDELLVEIKLNARQDQIDVLLGRIARARLQYPGARVLTLFASRVPDSVRTLLKNQDVAFAWIADGVIDGSSEARVLAPWLFQPSSFPLERSTDNNEQ